MSEENIKLTRVKKSCNVLKTITKVLFVIGIVATMLSLCTGIGILASGGKFDDIIRQSQENGTDVDVYLTGPANSGPKIEVFKASATDLDAINSFNSRIGTSNIQSDIPALQKYADEHPYSLVYGTYLLSVSLCVVMFTVVMWLISSTFALIAREESPFHKKVLKKVLISMIILSVFVGMTTGFGFGAVCGVLTWAIYTILDYGRTLQTQVDETI